VFQQIKGLLFGAPQQPTYGFSVRYAPIDDHVRELLTPGVCEHLRTIGYVLTVTRQDGKEEYFLCRPSGGGMPRVSVN
jgi:hypothetical protein